MRGTPQDVARHPLLSNTDHGPELGKYLADRWWTSPQDLQSVYVGAVIADVCAVGYGGHYDEVLEDAQEGKIMTALAEWLAPVYANGDEAEMYLVLTIVRDEWCMRLRTTEADVLEAWLDEGFGISGVEAET